MFAITTSSQQSAPQPNHAPVIQGGIETLE